MTNSEHRTWETIKQQYLREVSKALSSVRHPRSKTVLDDVRSHLDRRYGDLAPDLRTPENLQAIITEMGPASDYAELLEPERPPRRALSMRSVAVAGAVALAVVLALVVCAWAVMLRSGQDKPVTIVQPPEYRSDYTFKDDPAVIGAWRSIDLVDSITQFVPGRKTSNRELWLNHLVFEPGGQVQGAIFTWTKGLVLCAHEKMANRYQIRQVDGADYLFFEWIGNNTNSSDGVIPHYYIMERVPVEAVQDQAMIGQTAELPVTSHVDEHGHIVDKIDYPFLNDPNVLGYWQSVDFVADVCDFVPGQKQFRGDLFLKELYILPEGKTNWAFHWTAGLILHNGDKTASQYLLQNRDGETYMFFEWKSGDYTLRHQRPSYYVLKKGPDRPYVETRVTDKIDYPFVDDPNVIGTWKSVDFVAKPDDFHPNRKNWPGSDLFLKELVFLADGKTPHSGETWTRGLVIDHGDQTASQYLIRQIDGQTYLFFEWKSGSYTRWRMDPDYYVLKKQLLGCMVRADINQQVAQLDIDKATLKDVIQVFGQPLEYRWGKKVLDVNEIPADNYCVGYGEGLSIWMKRDMVVELRFGSQDSGYVWKDRVRVGMPLEQVLAVLGQPAKTVEGGENLFADRVLYKDIEGNQGHCYYALSDQRLRLWFMDNKLSALYLTRSDFERRFGSRELDMAKLPATSVIDEKGRIMDKIDYPFVDDPNVRGYWQSVDFVRDIEDFVPDQKFGGDLFLKELYMLPDGKTNWAFTWTAGLILHNGDKTASQYLLQNRDGETYMFLEWKSGDYAIRHRRPSYYVLKKGPDRPYVETRVTDKIDYPFVDDPGLIGTWKSVDFVDTPDQFDPNQVRWQGDLFLKELVFLPEGKTPHSWQTWTKGLILHHGDQTASEYQIKEIDGQTYLFFQWKSGDYTLRGMKPHYYVLKRQ